MKYKVQDFLLFVKAFYVVPSNWARKEGAWIVVIVMWIFLSIPVIFASLLAVLVTKGSIHKIAEEIKQIEDEFKRKYNI